MTDKAQKIITLKRLLPRLSDRTFGVMSNDSGYPFCLTVERAWKNNVPEISCIPLGEYTIQRKSSAEFGFELFEVLNVVGRSAVEIHKGNFFEDSKGCIILGSSFGYVLNKEGQPEYGVQGSKDAFNVFMNILNGIQQAKLIIVEA